MTGGLAGGAIGGVGGLVHGAYSAGKGKRLGGALKGGLRGAAGGALVGGGLLGGLSAGLAAGAPNDALLSTDKATQRAALQNMETSWKKDPAQFPTDAANILGLSSAGAAVGGLAGNQLRNMLPGGKSKKESPKKDTETKTKEDEKMASAFEFGEKLAMDPRLMGGLGGAALGAGVGGLAGLVNPGVDENGKRKSRLGAALKGALGGGAVGGLGGAAVGHFAPNQTQQFGSQIAGLLGGGKAGPSQAEQDHNRQMKALNRGFTRGWPSSETAQRPHALMHAVGEEPMVSIAPDYVNGGVSRRPESDLSVSQSFPGVDRDIAANNADYDRRAVAEGRPTLEQAVEKHRGQLAQQRQLQGAYGAEPMGPQ